MREALARDPGLLGARDEQGLSPILVALYHNEPSIAEDLLSLGADRTARTRDGKTALDIARERGNARVARLLET